MLSLSNHNSSLFSLLFMSSIDASLSSVPSGSPCYNTLLDFFPYSLSSSSSIESSYFALKSTFHITILGSDFCVSAPQRWLTLRWVYLFIYLFCFVWWVLLFFFSFFLFFDLKIGFSCGFFFLLCGCFFFVGFWLN